MFAYDYLKENPQLRDKQLKVDWASLMATADTPYGTKKELLELAMIDAEKTDALLYWHKEVTLHNLIEKKPITISDWSSPYIERLYNIKADANIPVFVYFINKCPKHINISDLGTLRMICENIAYGGWSAEDAVLSAVTNINANAVVLKAMTNDTLLQLHCKDADLLLERCSMKFLASIRSATQIGDIYQLLKDTPSDKVFDSKNELQAEHDKIAEEAVAQLLKHSGDTKYIYDEEYVAICEKYKFILPIDAAAFVKRGSAHHNCVGSYADRSVACTPSASAGILTRLLFTGTATIELNICYNYDKIYLVRPVQNKGAYNKDQPVTESLVDLCIELTGKPSSILNTKVIKG